jgi:mycofactocin precursor
MAVTDPVPEAATAAVEPVDDRRKPPAGAAGEELVESDLLVEDVSIDGMCGVY